MSFQKPIYLESGALFIHYSEVMNEKIKKLYKTKKNSTFIFRHAKKIHLLRVSNKSNNNIAG